MVNVGALTVRVLLFSLGKVRVMVGEIVLVPIIVFKVALKGLVLLAVILLFVQVTVVGTLIGSPS